jgi:hypothetical protein
MRYLPWITLILWPCASFAQPPDGETPAASPSRVLAEVQTGVIGEVRPSRSAEFEPLTMSDRLRIYVVGTFGPGAFARAAVTGAFGQARGTPKEWGGGAEAFGERVGDSFAKHVIRETIESGAAAALHEDNRYLRSTEQGLWKRSRHALAAIFLARNEAGHTHFAYSGMGGAAGAAFISRAWQPRSVSSAGDGATTFGISMALDATSNVFHEFWPDIKRKLKRGK